MDDEAGVAATKACPQCGATFACGVDCGACWCGTYPRVMPVEVPGDCRCPACLARAVAARVGDFMASVPHDDALRIALAQPAGGPLVEHIDYTVENGEAVFTAWYLLKQGGCCGNGCRNCPYPTPL